MNNFPEYLRGPSDSPAYAPIMGVLITICALGFLSSMFPIIDYIVGAIVAVALLVTIIRVVEHIRREHRLDWEAQYGPLTEEEKEYTSDK